MIVKVPGTVIELGGDRYVLPPLALGAVEQMGDQFEALLGGKGQPQQFGPVIDLIHSSLKRNYPEIGREVVASNLDLGNLESTFGALMKNSGLTREEKASAEPGELPAATAG